VNIAELTTKIYTIFGVKDDKFGVKDDKFGVKDDKFGVKDDKFKGNKNAAKVHRLLEDICLPTNL